MIQSRESLYTALFALLSTTPGFQSYFRRFPPIEQLKTAQLPALLMRQVSENATSLGRGIPDRYQVLVELCIVASTPPSQVDAVPASIINPLIDAIEAQLAPSTATGVLDLGLSNVSRVWIEGEIRIFEAVSNDRTFVEIPVNIISV